MPDAALCTRLPDLPITLVDGSPLNLAHFCGQKLVVFFCPGGGAAAAEREILAYEALAEEFEHAGAWLIGIVATGPPARARSSRIHIGVDAGGAVFEALSSRFPDLIETQVPDGATFLIDRDGSIRHAWTGSGHARLALEGVRERP